jgi:uncharacterized membrane protein
MIYMRKTAIIPLAIVIISFAIGIYFYPQMPDRMPSHWNAYGQIDGYSSRELGLFLVPGIMLVFVPLFLVIPKIDPLKGNIMAFIKYYDGFIILFSAYMLYLYLMIIVAALGIPFNMTEALIPAISALFIYIGILLSKAKQNWFIGIRTPWTLSSGVVWEKTHKIGSKLFIIAGIVSLIGVAFPPYGIFVMIISVLLAAVITVVYSYLEYQKVKNN